MELAGIVTEVGAGVDGWAVGDSVMASVNHGAFAEECIADPRRMVRLPANVSFVHGAAFIIAYGTALHTLQNRAHTTSSDTVLILGASRSEEHTSALQSLMRTSYDVYCLTTKTETLCI